MEVGLGEEESDFQSYKFELIFIKFIPQKTQLNEML